MFIESVVPKKFYEGLEAGYISDIDFSIEWVAKNPEELKERGIDPDFIPIVVQHGDTPPDEEYYYIRIWLNCSLDDIGMETFLRYLD